MKRLLAISSFALLLLVSLTPVGLTSCTKQTTIRDTTVVIHRDTTVVLAKDTIPVVSAGRDTTIQLKSFQDTVQLSGSAMDAYGPIVSYLWSQVSGPNSATIINPGSPSAMLTGLVVGKYTLQLMSVDNDGETGVKMVNLTILAPALRTITLQGPAATTDLSLAYINGVGDVSDPNAVEFTATAWTNGTPAITRGLFRFDLSSIPLSAKIISAKLSLYSNPLPRNGDLVHANYGTNNTMLIQRATGYWDASTKWQTQPATDPASQIVIPHTDQPFLDLLDVDVTGMVQTMVSTNSNFGWLIKLQTEVIYNSRIFVSSKNPDATRYPKLVVQYSN